MRYRQRGNESISRPFTAYFLCMVVIATITHCMLVSTLVGIKEDEQGNNTIPMCPRLVLFGG